MIGTRSAKGKVVSATSRQMIEQVLYHKTSNGEFKATITDYWDRVVCRVEPNFDRHSFSKGDRRVVCPFHDDVEPSLGLVIDKETGVEVFNCFGCGAKGTVVVFHELFFKKFGIMKSSNSLDYLKKLASIYKIPLTTTVVESKESMKAYVDFSKVPSYNLKIHKANIKQVKDNRETLGVIGVSQYWDMITGKILSIKKKEV